MDWILFKLAQWKPYSLTVTKMYLDQIPLQKKQKFQYSRAKLQQTHSVKVKKLKQATKGFKTF